MTIVTETLYIICYLPPSSRWSQNFWNKAKYVEVFAANKVCILTGNCIWEFNENKMCNFLFGIKTLFQDGFNDDEDGNDRLIILGVVMMKEMMWLGLIHCESMLAWCKWMKTEEKGFDAVLIVCALALSSSVFSHRHSHFYGSCWNTTSGMIWTSPFTIFFLAWTSWEKLTQAETS